MELEKEKQREMQQLLMERQQMIQTQAKQQESAKKTVILIEDSKSAEIVRKHVNPQMKKDEQEFAKLLSAQKARTHENTQKLMAVSKKKKAAIKFKVDEKKQKMMERDAISEINEATLAGIKAGEAASRKLHADAKKQSEEATTTAVEKLKDKFDATRKQVLAIVQNFGQIRSEISEIKGEFLQEYSAIGQQPNLVQLNTDSGSGAEQHLADLQHRIGAKERQLEAAWASYSSMQESLVQLQADMHVEADRQKISLLEMRNEQDDAQLVEVFEQESESMR